MIIILVTLPAKNRADEDWFLVKCQGLYKQLCLRRHCAVLHLISTASMLPESQLAMWALEMRDMTHSGVTAKVYTQLCACGRNAWRVPKPSNVAQRDRDAYYARGHGSLQSYSKTFSNFCWDALESFCWLRKNCFLIPSWGWRPQ